MIKVKICGKEKRAYYIRYVEKGGGWIPCCFVIIFVHSCKTSPPVQVCKRLLAVSNILAIDVTFTSIAMIQKKIFKSWLNYTNLGALKNVIISSQSSMAAAGYAFRSTHKCTAFFIKHVCITDFCIAFFSIIKISLPASSERNFQL